jgi:hypothetical protein
MKFWFIILLFVPALPPLFAAPLYSPAWGFRLDLPEGYELIEGNGKERFSFAEAGGARFDLAVYQGTYKTMKDMVDDVNRRLKNQGDVSFFEYQGKLAALIELRFGDSSGWGLCVELAAAPGGGKTPPMLLALAFGPAGQQDLEPLHLSALDSIAPSEAERRCPGPVTEFSYPRGGQRQTALALPGLTAQIRENDAEAAQALVDREFVLLRKYLSTDNWREAWIRFYRAVYRDSWDRLADAVFQLERKWNLGAGTAEQDAAAPAHDAADRALAEKALAWVQTFQYERDLLGSDFVNLVSAVTEGRGDCDSRAMLWAMILAQADIPAAIMVSREHSHALGLADIAGTGARFEAQGTKWLVAETTAKVDIGLIRKDLSDIESWLGVIFE